MKRFLCSASYFGTVCLGLIFLLAAFSKVGNIAEFHQSLIDLAFLPWWVCSIVTFLLPGFELVMGTCLLARTCLREVTFCTTFLLFIFTVFSIYLESHGHRTCPCMKISGSFMNPTGAWLVARDVFLLAIGLFCYQIETIGHRKYSLTGKI
jgi:hypothetical protein